MFKTPLIRKILNWIRSSKPDAPVSMGEMFQNIKDKQSFKWGGYLQHYERYFSPLKDKPISLLEIGIQEGGSLDVWAKYFESATNIVGCDIDPSCATLAYEDSRIQVLIGDINAPSTLSELDRLAARLDIIIDDGSHQSKEIIQSFVQLFPRLSEDGLYLIEDLHCSYWQNFGGGLYDPTSAISFFKKIIDVVNREAWGTNTEFKDFFARFSPTLLKSSAETNWQFLNEIHSIEFVNSICFIRKRSAQHNLLGQQVPTNTPSCQDPSFNCNLGFEMIVPDQTSKAYSYPLDNELQNEDLQSTKIDEITRLKYEISKLEDSTSDLKKQFYEATKNFYDASVTIQQLELKIKQLEQSNQDAV